MNYIFYNTKPFEISFLVQCIVYSISEQCRTCTGKPANPGRKTFLVPYSIFKVLQQGLFFFFKIIIASRIERVRILWPVFS